MGRWKSFAWNLARDQDGGVLVEATVLIPILFVFLLGAVDFLFAYYEWNTATKALNVGVRIAVVSDPVASGLNSISTNVLSTVPAGNPMPPFQVTCNGATASCTCQGSCPGMGTFSWAAMNKIVCGRDNTSNSECDYSTQCRDTRQYFMGMCDVFSKIRAANVKIVYTGTGLGFAGRDGGPVPTVSVSLQNLPFQFFFLGDLLGFAPHNIGPAVTTMTGEVLSSAAQ